MIRQLLAYAIVTGCTLAVAARCAEAACRRLRIPARWAWLAALGLSVALVAAAPWRVEPPAPRAAPSGVQAATVRPGAVAAAIVGAVERPAQMAFAAVSRLSASAVRWIAIVWAAGTALLLSLITTTQARTARERRRWPRTTVQGTLVHVAPNAGPAALGFTSGAIVVPRWLLARTDAEQQLVIAHEAQHAQARDPLLLTLASALAALVPWHPAIWWMVARLRLCIEVDCDGRVLRGGASPRTYGDVLIDLARHCSGSPLGKPALAGRRTQLERRLLAMTTTSSRITRITGGALAAIAVCALVAACGQTMPTGDAATRDVTVTKVAAVPHTMTSRRPFNGILEIDGRRASKLALDSIDASRIASIEVFKGARASAMFPNDSTARNGVIRVHFKAQLDSVLVSSKP